MDNLPNWIGLCGNPKAGKTEIQKILFSEWGYLPADDGIALREIAKSWLGLSHHQCYTQEGKAEYVEILGRKWQCREVLGELGNRLEAMFGDHIMPYMTTLKLDPNQRYSFGSVRKNQGAFYKARGGMIIGIHNPVAPPSPYAFDRFDQSAVDLWINNDPALGLAILKKTVIRDLSAHFQKLAA